MRNAFERNLGAQLKKAKIEFEYEPIKIQYVKNYIPDFVLDNGTIIEAKGRFIHDDAAKMIAVKTQHPELDIRFVFYNAHAKISRSKLTYANWADKNGFPWADGRIPEEWLK
jgi:hypothetical protein